MAKHARTPSTSSSLASSSKIDYVIVRCIRSLEIIFSCYCRPVLPSLLQSINGHPLVLAAPSPAIVPGALIILCMWLGKKFALDRTRYAPREMTKDGRLQREMRRHTRTRKEGAQNKDTHSPVYMWLGDEEQWLQKL